MKLASQFLESDAIHHSLSKGEQREEPVRNFLLSSLPDTFGLTKGEAIDLDGKHSRQIDILIYNRIRDFAMIGNDFSIMPIESVLATIEVKSLLNRTEAEKTLRAAFELRSMKPFRKPFLKRSRGAEAQGCRLFQTVFAYGSDLKKEGWAQSEYSRIQGLANEMKLDPTIIDRIYVVNRGIINCENGNAAEDDGDSARSLMYFYMHLLNFLSREDGRRRRAPYLDYAGRLTQGWKRLSIKMLIIFFCLAASLSATCRAQGLFNACTSLDEIISSPNLNVSQTQVPLVLIERVMAMWRNLPTDSGYYPFKLFYRIESIYPKGNPVNVLATKYLKDIESISCFPDAYLDLMLDARTDKERLRIFSDINARLQGYYPLCPRKNFIGEKLGLISENFPEARRNHNSSYGFIAQVICDPRYSQYLNVDSLIACLGIDIEDGSSYQNWNYGLSGTYLFPIIYFHSSTKLLYYQYIVDVFERSLHQMEQGKGEEPLLRRLLRRIQSLFES